MKTNKFEQFDPADLDIIEEALCQYRSYLRARMNYRGDLSSIKRQIEQTNNLLVDLREQWGVIKREWKEKCR